MSVGVDPHDVSKPTTSPYLLFLGRYVVLLDLLLPRSTLCAFCDGIPSDDWRGCFPYAVIQTPQMTTFSV